MFDCSRVELISPPELIILEAKNWSFWV